MYIPNKEKFDIETVKDIKKFYLMIDYYTDDFEGIILAKEALTYSMRSEKRLINLQKKTVEKIEEKKKIINTAEYQKSIKLYEKLKEIECYDNYKKIYAERLNEKIKLLKEPNGTKSDKARYNKELVLVKEIVEKELKLEESQKITEIKAQIKQDENYKEHIKVYEKLKHTENYDLPEINKHLSRKIKEVEDLESYIENTKNRIKINGPILKDLYKKIKQNSEEKYFKALDLINLDEYEKNTIKEFKNQNTNEN